MNLILHFLLAHFLADYPFQSSALVRLKMKRYIGLFIHGLIHLIALVLVLFPVLHLQKVQLCVGIIAISHVIIDQIKVRLDKLKPEHRRLFYFGDQLLHNSILLGVSYAIGNVTPALSNPWFSLYTNQTLVAFVLLLVLSTYFFDVSRHFFLLKGSDTYKRDYKTMLRNALIIVVAFGIYWTAY